MSSPKEPKKPLVHCITPEEKLFNKLFQTAQPGSGKVSPGIIFSDNFPSSIFEENVRILGLSFGTIGYVLLREFKEANKTTGYSKYFYVFEFPDVLQPAQGILNDNILEQMKAVFGDGEPESSTLFQKLYGNLGLMDHFKQPPNQLRTSEDFERVFNNGDTLSMPFSKSFGDDKTGYHGLASKEKIVGVRPGLVVKTQVPSGTKTKILVICGPRGNIVIAENFSDDKTEPYRFFFGNGLQDFSFSDIPCAERIKIFLSTLNTTKDYNLVALLEHYGDTYMKLHTS